MSMFNEAYRAMVAKHAHCPKCGAENVHKASPTIEIDQTGTKGFCNACGFARPIEAFLPKEMR
jgi:predicted RNA-binding Zn-ribbon protein involved in translation (DUF1610 family)